MDHRLSIETAEKRELTFINGKVAIKARMSRLIRPARRARAIPDASRPEMIHVSLLGRECRP